MEVPQWLLEFDHTHPRDCSLNPAEPIQISTKLEFDADEYDRFANLGNRKYLKGGFGDGKLGYEDHKSYEKWLKDHTQPEVLRQNFIRTLLDPNNRKLAELYLGSILTKN